MFGSCHGLECNGSIPFLGLIPLFGSREELEPTHSPERNIRLRSGTRSYLRFGGITRNASHLTLPPPSRLPRLRAQSQRRHSLSIYAPSSLSPAPPLLASLLSLAYQSFARPSGLLAHAPRRATADLRELKLEHNGRLHLAKNVPRWRIRGAGQRLQAPAAVPVPLVFY